MQNKNGGKKPGQFFRARRSIRKRWVILVNSKLFKRLDSANTLTDYKADLQLITGSQT